MLKIRLMRIGAKKRPFYRVVAVDERAKRTGGYLELLGTYNPLTEPHEIKLKQDRIDALVKQGAQLSDGFLRIIGKAPQRPPRKPKKEKKEESSANSPQLTDKGEQTEEISEAPNEQPPSEEPETPANTSEVETEVKDSEDTSEVDNEEPATEEPKEEENL